MGLLSALRRILWKEYSFRENDRLAAAGPGCYRTTGRDLPNLLKRPVSQGKCQYENGKKNLPSNYQQMHSYTNSSGALVY